MSSLEEELTKTQQFIAGAITAAEDLAKRLDVPLNSVIVRPYVMVKRDDAETIQSTLRLMAGVLSKMDHWIDTVVGDVERTENLKVQAETLKRVQVKKIPRGR